MLRLSALQNKSAGHPAAVLGGGPSLPADLAKVRELTRISPSLILIAVNYHALYHCAPHYMVYNDSPETDPAGIMPQVVKDFPGIKVSKDHTSDILLDVPYWEGNYSSNLAAWFALFLGCNPVYLCGMDCYQGERVYCHDYTHDVPVFHYPLDDHLRVWQEEGVHKLQVDRIQVVSGPLQNIFGGIA